MIDVSLVLNLHRESVYLPRTLMSLKDACDYARAAGLVTEVVCVLDRPDLRTRQVLKAFDLSLFDHHKVIEVDRGSLGLARNDGIDVSRGKYIRLCDGDDLISYNMLVQSYCEAERLGPHAIIVPQRLFAFGERYNGVHYCGLNVVTPMALLDIHPFISQIFFRNSLPPDLRFVDLKLSSGYAYEDWHFAADAVAEGYVYDVAPETILFYRQRRGNLLAQADQLSVRQIPPSKLFEPKTYRTICRDSYERFVSGGVVREAEDVNIFTNSVVGRHALWSANVIDPAVDFNLIRGGHQWHATLASDLRIGRRYYEICEQLEGRKFKNIFILPFFGKGGAEKYFRSMILELCQIEGQSDILVILGEHHRDNEHLKSFPDKVAAVDLAVYLDEIGERGIDLMTLKLIQSTGVDSCLHFRPSLFASRILTNFGRALRDHRRIYYHFGFGRDIVDGLTFTQAQPFHLMSEYIDDMDVVVVDGERLRSYDSQRIGVANDKWKLLPTRHHTPYTRPEVVRRLAAPTASRVAWASRICGEKRPDVLLKIARKSADRGIDLTFDVFGVVVADFDVAQFGQYPNISYHGSYNSFHETLREGYVGFIYTSLWDGLPNVLLEAAGAGLPIIAPDVGAVGSFIEDGATGILLPDLADVDQMADAYLGAIARLQGDQELRRRLALAAYDRAEERFGSTAYLAALQNVIATPHGSVRA